MLPTICIICMDWICGTMMSANVVINGRICCRRGMTVRIFGHCCNGRIVEHFIVFCNYRSNILNLNGRGWGSIIFMDCSSNFCCWNGLWGCRWDKDYRWNIVMTLVAVFSFDVMMGLLVCIAGIFIRGNVVDSNICVPIRSSCMKFSTNRRRNVRRVRMIDRSRR